MKKFVSVMASALVIAGILAGCGASSTGSGSGAPSASTSGTSEDVYRIAIVQPMSHTSLDQIRDTIVSELEASGKSVEITTENANGDSTALSTILSWSYYGERCWGYLSRDNKVVSLIYKIIFILVCIVGATGSGTLMWSISDTLNAMMAIPNLIALLLLSGVVAKITREYFCKDRLRT